MTKYLVEYSCSIPEWGDVTLDADNENEAENKARDEIEFMYPEAMDVTIDGVKIVE